MPAEHSANPLSHVMDSTTMDLPFLGEVHVNIFGTWPTRLMVTELLVALTMAAVIIPLARHISRNRVTRGFFFNLFETIVLFIRDEMARPAIDGEENGSDEHHDDHAGHADDRRQGAGSSSARLSDHFLPYLLTVFFFILFNNLIGLVPGGASATGNINVTGVLALSAFAAVVWAGSSRLGPIRFWLALVPKLDVPIWLKPFLWGLMFVIEVAGLLIRHMVLAVRLFANILAGHIVLSVVLGFILLARDSGAIYYLVTPASVVGGLGLSLLEILVAFLQAYVFTFLAALFIGSAVHPH